MLAAWRISLLLVPSVQAWHLTAALSDFWNACTAQRSNHDGPILSGPKKAILMNPSTLPRICATICLAVSVGACSSIGLGVSVPLIPGVSIGVGAGSGGVNAGVSAGRGPVSVGVGVNQSGQVTGGAGVGASTNVGGARVGAGVGTSTVIHDPNDPARRDKGLAR